MTLVYTLIENHFPSIIFSHFPVCVSQALQLKDGEKISSKG